MRLKKETIARAKWCLVVYGFIFAWMLVCNLLTPYLVDDFNYMYSFATGERISSVLDISPPWQPMPSRSTAGWLPISWCS